MVKIIEGKYKKLSMDNGVVKLEIKGKKLSVTNKAMWSLLRTHYTRKIDKEAIDLKSDMNKSEWRGEFKKFFLTKMNKVMMDQRELQYIIDEEKNRLIAVATQSHSLMSKDEVYKVINMKIKEMGLMPEKEESVIGQLVFLDKTDYADYGLQVIAGDITTRRAISISMFVRAKGMGMGCLNPLSFMGLNRSITRKILGDIPVLTSKLLRFEKKEQLPIRIGKSIESMRPHVMRMKEKLSKGIKYPSITEKQSMVILSSMCSSYSIGQRVTQSCLDEFRRNEQTLLGLSMATSTVVKHKGKIFKKGVTRAKQNLSDISGALLLIGNVKNAVKMSKEYLRERPEAKELHDKLI